MNDGLILTHWQKGPYLALQLKVNIQMLNLESDKMAA